MEVRILLPESYQTGRRPRTPASSEALQSVRAAAGISVKIFKEIERLAHTFGARGTGRKGGLPSLPRAIAQAVREWSLLMLREIAIRAWA